MPRKKIIFIKKCATCNSDFAPGKHKQTLNCSPECLKIYKEKHKDEIIKKMYNTIKEKYGVDHPSQMDGFADKVKKTKKERYGDENYCNREMSKKTCVEKYGVDNPLKLEENRLKLKNTKKEKYGDENFNNRVKAKITVKEKYGVDHHLQNKEILEKQFKTNREKYGTEFQVLTQHCKDEAKKKNTEKYGTEYYFSSDEYKNKTFNTKINRLKEVLKNNNLEFDLESYTKSRIRGEDDGKLHYIRYSVVCLNCNNTFDTTIKSAAPICRTCFPIVSCNSKLNQNFKEFLESLDVNFIENDRKTISPLELDFLIKDQKIAFELNGNYYHSEISGERDKRYHIGKTTMCNEKGITLIHIFEDEWILKNEIVKSRIKNFLNKTERKIYARNCEIREIENSIKKNFLIENHIQGDSNDKYRMGLFYKNELVSVMTFCKKRLALGNKKSNDLDWELLRFCSLKNTNIIGSFNKLLSHFLKNNEYNSIITFADCRWSGIDPNKTVYNKNFQFIEQTKCSYFYILKRDYQTRYHRFSLNKQTLLKKFNGDKSKTEWELAQENGYDRIWDCGCLKFIYTKQK